MGDDAQKERRIDVDWPPSISYPDLPHKVTVYLPENLEHIETMTGHLRSRDSETVTVEVNDEVVAEDQETPAEIDLSTALEHGWNDISVYPSQGSLVGAAVEGWVRLDEQTDRVDLPDPHEEPLRVDGNGLHLPKEYADLDRIVIRTPSATDIITSREQKWIEPGIKPRNFEKRPLDELRNPELRNQKVSLKAWGEPAKIYSVEVSDE